MKKLSKVKAMTVLLYDTMILNVRKPRIYFMRILEVNERELARPIDFLRANNLVKSYGGNMNGGIEKIREISLDNLCLLLGIQVKPSDELIQECEALVDETRQLHVCDVCNESVPYVNSDYICVGCLSLTDLDISQVRTARCGHKSNTRYFSCNQCKEYLEEEDDLEYSIGAFHSGGPND
jgi:hypothetical protein